jgi:hypothetical protein
VVDDRQVFLRASLQTHDELFAIRREDWTRDLPVAAGDPDQLAGNLPGLRVELDGLDVRLLAGLYVQQPLPVARETQVPVESRGRADGFGLTPDLSRLFVDFDPPETHVAPAVTGEVEKLPVR